MKVYVFILFISLLTNITAQSRLKSSYKIVINKDSLYGVIDSNQNLVIPYEYQEIKHWFNRKHFKVKKNNKYGLVSTNNELIIPTAYDAVDWDYDSYSNKYLFLTTDKLIYLANYQGKIINKNPYSDIVLIQNNQFLILDSNKNFIIDTNGNVLSKKYSKISSFGKGKYLVFNTNDTNYKSRLNLLINIFIPFHCVRVDLFREIDLPFGKYGFLNEKFEEFVPLEYDDLSYARDENLFISMKIKNGKQKFGYIDTNCREVIPIIYDSISYIFNNNIVAKLNNKFIFFNPKGKRSIKHEFDSIFYRNHFFVVYKNGKCGIVNEKGRLSIPLKFTNLGSFEYGLINAQKGLCMGYINERNKVKIPLIYEGCSIFHNGLARVSNNNKIGFIDTLGKIIIPLMYDAAGLRFQIKDSLEKLIVQLGDKTFYINKKNECIEDCN